MPPHVDVAFIPAEAQAIDADAYVVIDVLRATTTIATLFHHGLEDLVVVDDIDAARRRALDEHRLLFGEVGGLAPEGFDHGNSPIEAQSVAVEGRGAVLFTTNGTRALCALGDRAAVFAGAAANASAIARRVARFGRVAFVCAGTESARRFAQEDFAAAGMMISTLQDLAPGLDLGDAAAIAVRLAGATRGRTVDLIHRPGQPVAELPSAGQVLIMTSEHARAVKRLGLERDVVFSARLDTSAAVPRVVACGDGWAVLRNEP